jgi:hypothetical protein
MSAIFVAAPLDEKEDPVLVFSQNAVYSATQLAQQKFTTTMQKNAGRKMKFEKLTVNELEHLYRDAFHNLASECK